MKRIDKFTKEEIKQAFRESKSLDAVARKLGYKDNSG
nr:MAG TPA: Sigma-70, region 4 [Bacteriophage sp.]